MEVKERVIDLRQYFIYIWENALLVIIIAGLFCGAMMGMSFKKQKAEIAASANGGGCSIDTIIRQNFNANNKIDDVLYTDVDSPAGAYNSTIRLFVDFNFDIVEGNEHLDYTQMVGKSQSDANLLLLNHESLSSIIDELGLKNYDDMKNISPEKLSYMVNRNFRGANVLTVTVTDRNPERVHKIVKAIVDKFVEKSEDFKTIDSVEIIDDDGIVEASRKSNGAVTSISKKKLLKYGIVGGVGGFIFICAILFLVFIFKDAVRTALDVEFNDMKLFGFISRSENKQGEDIKRIACNISLEKDAKTVLLVPADKASESEAITEGIKEELKKLSKDIKVEVVKNIKESADANIAAAKSDAAIILAKYGKTRMKDLHFAKDELDKTQTKILGAVLSGVRFK